MAARGRAGAGEGVNARKLAAALRLAAEAIQAALAELGDEDAPPPKPKRRKQGGVSDFRGRWLVRINLGNGNRKSLGVYDTRDQAEDVLHAAIARLAAHGPQLFSASRRRRGGQRRVKHLLPEKPSATQSVLQRRYAKRQAEMFDILAREGDAPLPPTAETFTAVRRVLNPGMSARPSHRVYFIQIGDGPVKVGWSSSVNHRLAGLQGSNPYPLRLLVDFRGSRDQKAAVHKMFEGLRLHGEWFAPGARLLAFIAAVQEATRAPVEAEP